MVNNQIIALMGLLAFSALFSGIETALMSLNMIKVNSLLKQKKKGSETLHRIKQNPHRLIITILIGNNLVNIGAASLATVVFTEMFGSSGIGSATGVMTVLMLIFPPIPIKAKYMVIIMGGIELYLSLTQPGDHIAHAAHL